MSGFAGKRVLVTGASRGIGYAVAEAFARAGADLRVLAEDTEIEEAAAALSELAGREVTGIVCDIADRKAVAAALDPLERLDVLVNNAGLELLTPVDEPGDAVEERFRRIVDINVDGSFWVTRSALPKIPDGGRILFTASVWGRTAEPGFAAYVASKHAVIGLTRTLAKELGPRRITVNAVCPGWVRTRASMRSLGKIAARAGRDEATVLEDITRAQALPGLMEPADVAATYLFLASDAASNITGQVLGVDRGELMA